jgi:hypothetical protein
LTVCMRIRKAKKSQKEKICNTLGLWLYPRGLMHGTATATALATVGESLGAGDADVDGVGDGTAMVSALATAS